MKKIGVMAGTIIDTEMGVELLKEKGFDAYPYSVSKNCYEQDRLQFLSKEELEDLVLKKLIHMKENHMDSCFIYCNSLSSAINFNKLSQKINFKVITPYDAYNIIGNDYGFIFLLAANSISTKNIEEFIKNINPQIKFLSVGFLGLVNKIEQHKDKQVIIEKSAIKELLSFFEKTEIEINSKAIILACTHFPYIKDEIISMTTIPVIDPAEKMIELL